MYGVSKINIETDLMMISVQDVALSLIHISEPTRPY